MADGYPSDASSASPAASRRDHHATIFVPRDAARDAEAARRRWDPVMGDRIAERPERGVYVEVEDVEGGFRRLRADVVRPPFRPLAFLPHLTVVHPRTSLRGGECWEDVATRAWGRHEFTVTELTVTAFDGTGWTVVDRFALGASDCADRAIPRPRSGPSGVSA